jgi:hypothetical protein
MLFSICTCLHSVSLSWEPSYRTSPSTRVDCVAAAYVGTVAAMAARQHASTARLRKRRALSGIIPGTLDVRVDENRVDAAQYPIRARNRSLVACFSLVEHTLGFSLYHGTVWSVTGLCALTELCPRSRPCRPLVSRPSIAPVWERSIRGFRFQFLPLSSRMPTRPTTIFSVCSRVRSRLFRRHPGLPPRTCL